MYQANVVLLQSLFSPDAIRHIGMHSLSDEPLQVELPNLNIADKEVRDELNLDKKQAIDLKLLSIGLTNNTKVFSRLSAYILDKMFSEMQDDSETSFNIFSLHDWAVVITSIMVILELLFTMYLLFKLKALRSAILVTPLRAVANAQSQNAMGRVLRLTPKPNQIFEERGRTMIMPNVTYKEWVATLNDHVPASAVTVLIAASVIVIALVLLYRTFKGRSYTDMTEIYLEIKTPKKGIILDWGGLTHSSGSYRVRRSHHNGQARGGVKLTTKFGIAFVRIRHEMSFVETETSFVYGMLKERVVNPWTAWKIRRIISEGHYHLSLIITNKSRTVERIVTLRDFRFRTNNNDADNDEPGPSENIPERDRPRYAPPLAQPPSILVSAMAASANSETIGE